MPSRRLQLTQNGFTGIELLIVLTVVAIVALLIANNIQEALAKGRDIERRTEINAIRDKLEEYWHANESYPADFTPLSLAAETLTDPSGGLILISPATASANKPASSYTLTNSQPIQEYTYAPYNCSAAEEAGSDEAGYSNRRNQRSSCYRGRTAGGNGSGNLQRMSELRPLQLA